MGDNTPTARSHAYGLLRTILGDAVQRRLIDYNPCHIRGAGNAKRVKQIEPASLPQLETLTEAMPERYRLMILLAAWCGLRFGEITELRHKDIDLTLGTVKVRRAVVRADGNFVIGTPKSDAGTRDVNIPPHLLPLVQAHLDRTLNEGREGLLFPLLGDTLFAHDGDAPGEAQPRVRVGGFRSVRVPAGAVVHGPSRSWA